MSKRQSRPKRIQLKLFHHPKPKSPQWGNLPMEIQQKTVKLLAQLLSQHCERVRASNDRKEARGE
jgi:hypothetical protein